MKGLASHEAEYWDSPYNKWPDSQRVDEFAYTGEPKYLNPKLAHQLGVGVDVMQEVLGATEEDIKKAVVRTKENIQLYEETHSSVLVEAGIDPVRFHSDIAYRLDVHFHIEDRYPALRDDLVLFEQSDEIEIMVQRDPEAFSAAITKYLNFESVESFAATTMALEFIRNFYINILNFEQDDLDVFDYEGDLDKTNPDLLHKLTQSSATVRQTLTSALKDKSGNYLLNKRAQNVLEAITSSKLSYERDSGPFELTRGVYGAFNYDKTKLYIAPSESNTAIKAYLDSTDPEKPNQLYDIVYTKIIDAGTPLEMSEVLKGASHSDVILKDAEIKDFLFLQSEAMREIIKSDFGINLSELSIREQFHFLSYLKHTTVASAETMKLFVENYGVAALRAFLVGGYDENAAQNIMALGVASEAEIVKPIFESYAHTLDAADRFTKNIEKSGTSAEVSALLHEVQEGLLKRAGHMFDAGKQMALSEYGGSEDIPELIAAFRGVARMEDILSRIGTDNSLAYTRNNDREGSRNPLYDMGSNTFFFDIQDSMNDEKVQLKIFVRPTANQEGEARINFELYLEDLDENSELKKAFTQTIISRNKKKTVTRSVIRFGFDLDTTTNPPRFSFDMGRHTFGDDTMERTGDVLGNILEQVAPEGHNMTDFDPKFSDPKNFARIAEAFKKYFKTIALEAGQ